MTVTVRELIDRYAADAPLAEASTIPSAWYIDPRILDLERRTVFARSWQVAGRVDQVADPGRYLSCELPTGEPVVVVRGHDDVLRGFFNVCRHHAAAVVTEPEGSAASLRCPYHGWTYSLDGAAQRHARFRRRLRFRSLSERPCSARDGGLGEMGVRQARAGRAFAARRFSLAIR